MTYFSQNSWQFVQIFFFQLLISHSSSIIAKLCYIFIYLLKMTTSSFISSLRGIKQNFKYLCIYVIYIYIQEILYYVLLYYLFSTTSQQMSSQSSWKIQFQPLIIQSIVIQLQSNKIESIDMQIGSIHIMPILKIIFS